MQIRHKDPTRAAEIARHATDEDDRIRQGKEREARSMEWCEQMCKQAIAAWGELMVKTLCKVVHNIV